jgi:transposase
MSYLRFRPCSTEQAYLLPPSVSDWLPQEHVARVVAEVVGELDLSKILAGYERQDGRGQLAYHPEMMVRLLLYAYVVGQPSSRKIEQASYTDLAYRYLAANEHPDHDTIAEFRRRHLPALAELFVQVLQVCREAGMVKLGHVAIDGTKVKANASRKRSRTYQELCEQEQYWQKTVATLLSQAESTDQSEQQKPAETLPAHLAQAETRLAAIRSAKQALEQRAKEKQQAAEQAAAALPRLRAGRPCKGEELSENERRQRGKAKKALRRARQQVKEPTTAYNFVDPDARVMKDGATGHYVQGYNAQSAVDGGSQVIVACDVTQQENDKHQLAPMVEQMQANLGARPDFITADTGYWDTLAIHQLQVRGYCVLVPPERQTDQPLPANAARNEIAEVMRTQLKTDTGKQRYRQRAGTVEPVFGRAKQQLGFRRFSLRGQQKVRAEWALICCTHNLWKLFQHRRQSKLRSGPFQPSLRTSCRQKPALPGPNRPRLRQRHTL